MSNETTWTDDELQSHLATWDRMQQNGESFDLTIYNRPIMNAWEGSGYSLDFADEHVTLTVPQAVLVQQWLHAHTAKSQPNPRDTHFQNFARLLYKEIEEREEALIFAEFTPENNADNRYDVLAEQVCRLIAQRAYDLVLHTAYHISVRDLESLLMVEVAEKVPDIDAFPKEGEG